MRVITSQRRHRAEVATGGHMGGCIKGALEQHSYRRRLRICDLRGKFSIEGNSSSSSSSSSIQNVARSERAQPSPASPRVLRRLQTGQLRRPHVHARSAPSGRDAHLPRPQGLLCGSSRSRLFGPRTGTSPCGGASRLDHGAGEREGVGGGIARNERTRRVRQSGRARRVLVAHVPEARVHDAQNDRLPRLRAVFAAASAGATGCLLALAGAAPGAVESSSGGSI